MSKIATLPRAEEVEDDGFVTVSIPGLEAAAILADGRNAAPAPQTLTDLFLASEKAAIDKGESRLAAIEAEMIAVQEGLEVERRQIDAAYEAAVAALAATRKRDLARAEEDAAATLDKLINEKGDLSTVVNARHAAIEAIAKQESAE